MASAPANASLSAAATRMKPGTTASVAAITEGRRRPFERSVCPAQPAAKEEPNTGAANMTVVAPAVARPPHSGLKTTSESPPKFRHWLPAAYPRVRPRALPTKLVANTLNQG